MRTENVKSVPDQADCLHVDKQKGSAQLRNQMVSIFSEMNGNSALLKDQWSLLLHFYNILSNENSSIAPLLGGMFFTLKIPKNVL